VNSVPGGERLDRRTTGDDLGSDRRHNLMAKGGRMTTQHRIGSLSTFTILCLVLSAPVFAQVNGPPNGTIGAYFIDAGNAVSDSFVATTSFFTTGFVFAEWVPAGATPLTVDWSVGTSPFGSDIGSGIGAIGPVTNFCLSGAPVGSGFCGNNIRLRR
jgi:hypothetical protein